MAPFSPEELARFKTRVAPLAGVDLEAYKPRQMERRITALYYRASARSLDDLYSQLESSSERLAAFVDGLTINVSEFFRDPEHFDVLGGTILPELLDRHAHLRVWSAGCSIGAELFTVGMYLERLGALDRSTLLGTDLDRSVLLRAGDPGALYGSHEIQSVPSPWRETHFQGEGTGARFNSEAIRTRSNFAMHNLLADPPLADCQLILCRNVVIYLNEASKLRLFNAFAQSLVPGGVLFVGATERIFTHRELGFDPIAPFFYRKRADYVRKEV